MQESNYEWIDDSKIERYKKSLKTYFLIPFLFGLPILIIILLLSINTFVSNNNTFNKSEVADFVFPIITIVGIILFMIGPYFIQRFKIKRDSKGYRLAYKKDNFFFIIEESNVVEKSISLKEIKGIFIDNVTFNCFIARNTEEFEYLKQQYIELDREWDLAFQRSLNKAIYGGELIRLSIELYYKLFKRAIGARLLKVKELESFLDSVGKFEKEVENSKYTQKRLYILYKIKQTK